jgi:ERCC4-related helicase
LEQIELFDTCQKDYYAKLENDREVEIRNAAALIIKLQQISDGVILDDKGQATSVQSNKFIHLLGILDEFAESGQRVIVWFAFKASLALAFKTLGSSVTTLSGDTTFDSEGWRAGKYKACLATVGSGASLNDFADTQHAIIYSAPWSYRALQQAMGRTNRRSSGHSVCYYQFLQTDRGVDSLVYDTVRLTGEIEKTAIQSSIDIIRTYLENYGKII